MAVNEPPDRHQRQNSNQDDAIIIHRLHGRRIHKREAEHDVEENDEDNSGDVDHHAERTQPERTSRHVLPPSEDVRQDGKDVRRRRDDDEGTREGRERRGTAERDGAE